MNFISIAYAANEATSESGSSIDIASVLGKVFLAVIVIIGAVLVASFSRRWVRRKIEARHGEKHKEMVILYSRITFTAVLALGVVVALIAAGVPLEWFSGALGLGIGLALQGPMANFIAGLVLLSNDKFNLGDFVVIDDQKGTIIDIQSRATSLRGIDGAEITIPNSQMLSAKVVCYTRNPVRRVDIQIGVSYGTNLKQATDVILSTLKSSKDVEPEPAPVALVSEVADSAVILEARIWVDSHSKWWKVKSDVTHDIFNALRSAGVDIPYPVRTLRVDHSSSDLLAQDSHLLDNLKKIESEKQKVFEKVPSETSRENNIDSVAKQTAEPVKQATASF